MWVKYLEKENKQNWTSYLKINKNSVRKTYLEHNLITLCLMTDFFLFTYTCKSKNSIATATIFSDAKR